MIRPIVLVMSGLAPFVLLQDRAPEKRPVIESAEHLLQTADAEAGNLQGVDRAYGYWLISQAIAKISSGEEVEILTKSCDAALASESGEQDDMLRQKIQLDCLLRLKVVQPKTEKRLLPLAAPDVRQQILAADAAKVAKQGNLDEALAMLSAEVSRGARYPYGRAVDIIKALPSGDSPDKDRVFAQAVLFYRQKHDRFDIGNEDLGTLVVRSWREISPALVLQAADELLDVAKQEAVADSHLEIAVNSGAEGAAFGSLYQYRLFQLLPVLRALDPSRAEALVKDNAQLQSVLKKYANGLESLSSAYSDTPKDDEPFSMTFRIGTGPATGSAFAGLSSLQVQKQADAILGNAQNDPEGALMAAKLLQDVPDASGSPKADLLIAIANVAGRAHTGTVVAALQEVLKLVESQTILIRSRYRIQVAEHFLQIGEADKADGVLIQVLKDVGKLYAADTNSDDPNRALKSTWPSTVVARACVALGLRISPARAQSMISELPDPDLRVFARIELANALLRLPSYPALVHERHKLDRGYRVSTFPIPSSS